MQIFTMEVFMEKVEAALVFTLALKLIKNNSEWYEVTCVNCLWYSKSCISLVPPFITNEVKFIFWESIQQSQWSAYNEIVFLIVKYFQYSLKEKKKQNYTSKERKLLALHFYYLKIITWKSLFINRFPGFIIKMSLEEIGCLLLKLKTKTVGKIW